MKAKKIIVLALLLVVTKVSAQDYQKITFDNTIKYDSLSNIKISPKGDINHLKKFIGQDVIFLKRSGLNKNLPTAYINFETMHKNIVGTDTIWHKKRKKPKPKDYTVSNIYSIKYAAKHYKSAWVTYCGSEPLEYAFPDFATKYYNSNPTLYSREIAGYFTPYEEIEGKTFKILDISKSSNSSVESLHAMRFTLMSENGDSLYWYAKAPNSYPCSSISYPIVVKGFLDKIKTKYLNKDFYISDTKYNCSELVFLGNIEEYQMPHLVFKSKGSTKYVRLGSYPSLFSYEECEIYNMPDLNLLAIYEPKDYELALARKKEKEEKEKEEKRREKERKDKEEKEYNIKITKKYGSFYAKLILEQKVKIGMSKAMVEESWGKPNDINRTIGSFGVHEQWCYDDQYLYFEDGILTTIQD